MIDVTGKYSAMLNSFWCDLELAKDPSSPRGLDEIQLKLEQGDEKLLADFELLSHLVYGIRYGKITIHQKEGEADGKNSAVQPAAAPGV